MSIPVGEMNFTNRSTKESANHQMIVTSEQTTQLTQRIKRYVSFVTVEVLATSSLNFHVIYFICTSHPHFLITL